MNEYIESQLSLKYKLIDDVEWLELDGELSGELNQGESAIIEIAINSNEMDIGSYSAEILLFSSIESIINIPVTLLVQDNLLIGDVTMDGQINVADFVTLVTYILGQINLNDNQLWAADINTDNSINVADIVQLVTIILNE